MVGLGCGVVGAVLLLRVLLPLELSFTVMQKSYEMDRDIRIPVPRPTTDEGEKTPSFEVQLSDDGKVTHRGETISSSEAAKLADEGGFTRLRIVADRSVRHSDVKKVVQAFGERGLVNVVFSVSD